MTSDEEKDPPVPSYVEGVSLKRIHNDRDGEERETNDVDSPPLNHPEE
ncbi:hypothetical protein P4U43_04795 [Arthrobacter sp. EH-1B-1]|uniref:Uncharacterized protein n=1 Tax=Arthrobacter vasquezii TaxID=2977629 RepID=A0ABT6CUC2_9MICC|nr:hypothetical protein [Arthrobacter vasquezii]MDF9277107.1 hypothetical protein [Arthrobacter vasquezii]